MEVDLAGEHDSSTERSFVVLSSVPGPLPTTNPYVVMLNSSLAAIPGVTLRYFSWRTALLGRYDVFHVHWPETLVTGGTTFKRAVRQVLFVAVLLRMRVLGIPLVRTAHNLELPQDISPIERALLRLADRRTALRITVNTATHVPEGLPAETVIHGHYRDWFASYAEAATVRGRVTFFGAVRRYKGVQALVEAFRETAGRVDGLTLHVAGRPSSDALDRGLRAAAAGDVRIELRLAFLSDAELVREVGEAELVVLPYPEMHNSGGVLAALSLGRPVLVPDNGVNRELAEEVGPRWVRCYPGPLRGQHIIDALARLRTEPEAAKPDLSARDWTRAGEDHLAAFRRAVAIVCRAGAR